MGIEIEIKCNECEDWINENEKIYCFLCFGKLKNKISNLEEKMGQQEDEIIRLEQNLNFERRRIK